MQLCARLFGLAAAFLFVFLLTDPVVADNHKRISDGRAVAERWCIACHVTETRGDTRVNDAAPPFVSIARREGATAGYIEAIIADPHGGMPTEALSRKEIKDVAAYILSLK